MMEKNEYFIPRELPVELLKDLLPDFFTEVWEDLHKIIFFLKKNDLPTVSHLAHKIKGAALSYGAIKVYDSALRLEKKVKSLQLENIDHSVKELKNSISSSYKYSNSNF